MPGTLRHLEAHNMEREGKLLYMVGFHNEFSSEAVPGGLPLKQNNPQACPLGLYAEQINGTSFTTPRGKNSRSWMYRIRPSVGHSEYTPISCGRYVGNFHDWPADPSQSRWNPTTVPEGELVDFVQGITTVCGAGDPSVRHGIANLIYACNTSMVNKAMYNADGDYLIVPQEGTLDIRTEFGCMTVQPTEICVIQRGIKFSVAVSGHSRGFICETYGAHMELPSLGPIGANGLANPRDFLTPVASYEEFDGDFTIVCKFQSSLFELHLDHSCFDVVAWHGNYAPYKYDLKRFAVVGSISFDHLDPSVFTVLTCPTTEHGTALCDFVIFPPRWAVQEHTFRPPYFHRNCMAEFMGLLSGVYEAKKDGGFVPGGSSLHNMMTPHGPDRVCYEKASTAPLGPERVAEQMLAFMFESSLMLKQSPWAHDHKQAGYIKVWDGLNRHFAAPLQ